MTMLKLFTKFLTCMMVVVLWTAGSQAQLAIKYNFAVSSGTYTSISGTGTSVAVAGDDVAVNITGLPGFTVNGVSYTNARMGSNGWIILYNTTAPTLTGNYTPLSTASGGGTSTVVIAPFGRDLDRNNFSGTAWRQQIGNELIFEWKDYNRFGITGDKLNFQVRLNTSTGAISFVYGLFTAGTSTSYPQIGFKTTGTTASNWSTDINNLMLDVTGSPNSCNWSDVVTGNANSSTVYLNSANSGVSPSSGLTYTWTPQSNPDPVRAFAAVSGITGSSATLSWTAPTGATQYNVRYRQVGSCAWTNFAGNPVSSATATLTGLSAGTYYQYQVQAKASGGDESIWSHIPDAAGSGSGYIATGSFQTTISCYPPTALTSTNITTTTADISWTAPGSPPSSGYQWEVRSSGVGGSGPTGLAASGSTGVGDTDDNVTGLTANTNYTLWVRSNCGSGDYSTWAGPASFTTQALTTPPWSEGFPSATLPAGWALSSYSGPSNSVTALSGTTTYYLYKNLYSSATTGSFTTINVGTLAGTENLSFTYKLANFSSPYGPPAIGSGNFVVAISTDFGATYTDIATESNNGVAGWQAKTYSLAGYAGQTVKVRITGNWTSGDYYLGFDDFKIETPPSCNPPSALTSSNITATTADISWTPPSPAPSNGYEYYYSTSNTPPGGSGTPTAGTSVSLLSLTSNTTYYFWVRSDCGGSGYSTWAGPASFKTACSPGSIPFTEGFESGYTDQTAVGGCWTQQSMAGAEVWTANSSLTSYNRTPRTGSFNAYLRWGNTDWLFYPLTLTGGTTYKFSVYARQDGSTSSDADITLAYGSTASDAGMTNVVVSAQGIVNGNYQEVTGNFTPASSGTYYIGIKGYINSSPFYISLDDISVIVAPTDAVDWCNLQHPPTGNITAGQNLTVYTQGYEPGVTPGTGAGSGISAWIGYSSSDTDPSGGGWTWVSATFNVEVGNNDEFKADIGSNLAPGTYYYASRWQLNGGPYKYGGYSSGGGGFWNGTTYVNGMLTINPLSNDECTGAIDVPVTPEVASQPVAGTILGATPSSGSFGSGCNIYSDNKDIWYKVTVPASGNVTIETFVTGGTSDSDNDYSFQVYSGSCGSLTYINCSEDANLYGTPASYMPALALTGQTPGATLYIRLRKSSSSSQTSFTIAAYDPTLTVPLATSDCSQGSVDVTVANGNGYRFVPLFDNSGNLIAELFAHGQDLGTVNASVYRNTTPPVRQDAAGVYYLDRDFTIKVTNQPSSNVDFYLWFTDAEFSALQTADPSITGIGDLKATKNASRCGKEPETGGTLLTNYDDVDRLADNAHAVAFSANSFSTFYLHGGSNPLPVNLIDFTARATKEGMVELNWIVAEEKGMKEYVVERSTDGRNFIAIGTVSAAQKTDYALTDNRPVSAVNYYRLKMVDRDGAFKYSEVRQVVFSNGRLLSLYPNPTSGHVYVSGLEGVKDAAYVNIYNEMGMSIYSGKIGGDQLASGGIDMSKYAPGAYMIRVISDEANTTMRFVKE